MAAENETSLGINRTGIQMSPQDSKRLLENAEEIALIDPQALAAVRKSYIDEADPLGSVPLPGSLKGVAMTGAKILAGHHPELFLDKLAERLAFERTGTRIYDALITKFNASEDIDDIVTREELIKIRNEEAKHFHLLSETIRSMGGDPTSQTPSADLAGIESMGLIQAVNDPRTSFVESLHAVLIAELADVSGWESLSMLAEQLDETDAVSRFRAALSEENDHLKNVQRWYDQLTMSPIQKRA